MLFSTTRLLARLALAATLIPVVSHAGPTPYIERPEVQTFINDMVKQEGVKRETLTQLMSSAEYKQSIIDAISKPAEFTMTWARYRKIFITEDRINKGVTFYHTHQAALKRAEKQYGIPAEMVVAIIGVETKFGENKGNFRVVDALSTLGFDYPPRAKFFRQQLREFVLLGPKTGIDLQMAVGSYAGAIGFPQFIPSSYRAFAVDFDADSKIDLINNPVDAIGSVAHYFRKHYWTTGAEVVTRAHFKGTPQQLATLEKRFNQSLKPNIKAGELAALGLVAKKPLPPATVVSPMKLEGDKGPQYWIGLNNFYVITRYNQSSLYAMAAYQLSQKIKEKL